MKKKITRPQIILVHCLLLTAVAVCLVMTILPQGYLFGSQTDWFCQHVTIADYMRKLFYETGKLLPDWSDLGGGSNFYNLTYYGLLRPDILISYFLPQVPMTAIIEGYAILEIIAGSLLLYYWLEKKGISLFYCLITGFLYLTAGCLFQAHRQIMFVNYLPYLILALLFIDRIVAAAEAGTYRPLWLPGTGLTLSLLMIVLHSFYFFPSCFAACTIYLVFSIKDFPQAERRKICFRGLLAAGLSVFLSMVLLLPTALSILENKKDVAGTSLIEIFSVNPALDGLLYNHYGCGLTVLCLYALFLSIKRHKTRVLASILLLLVSFQFFHWILNGTLYVRPKSLIPFVPLFLFLTARTLQDLHTGGLLHSPLLAALCIVPGILQAVFLRADRSSLILADCLLVLAWSVICRTDRPMKPILNTALCLALCAVPALFYVKTAQKETFVPISTAQEEFTDQELADFYRDSRYRMDFLSSPTQNANYVFSGSQKKSTLYSSVSNSNYNHLYYDILKTPVSIRNRVSVNADMNPFQEYLMGVRYIQTSEEKVPAGYEIREEKDGTVLAENTNVLPLAYGSSSLMSEDDFDVLSYPQNLDTLINRTIVPDAASEKNDTDFARYESQMTAYPLPEDFFARSSHKKHTVTRALPVPVKDSILLLSFDVDYRGQKDVDITVNGVRNRLSGSSAAYPNRNTTFTYMLSGNDTLSELKIAFSGGNYKLSNIKAYTLPLSAFAHPGITPFTGRTCKKGELLSGTLSMEEDGYFVTSLAFSGGYTAIVDGKRVTPECVNTAFVGFPIKKGTHEIVLTFHAPGKTAGGICSLLALLYFSSSKLVWLLLVTRRQRRRSVRLLPAPFSSASGR